nr:glycosyltransferase family 1 protein [Desulfobacterales bacterium]
MRILHLIYDDIENPWCGGGGAVRAYEINRRLAQRHNITVITGNYPGAEDEVVEGVRYVRIGSGKDYLFSRVTYSLQMHRVLSRMEYDLVVEDFSPFSPCFACLHTERPVVTLIHTYLGLRALRKYPLRGLLAIFFERLNLRLSTFIITVSPWLERRIHGKTQAKGLIRCICNGVDEKWFNIRNCAEDNYILYIGRIDFYTKGMDTLLKAFTLLSREVPGITLRIVGKGKRRDLKKAHRLVDTLNLHERVEFIGPVYDFERKAALYAKSQFVCIPSRTEGWPIVAIEAAAAGKAILGSRIPGLLDAVINGETGMLVPSDDPKDFCQAMHSLLQDGKRRKQLGANGRRWAARFRWDSVAKEQEAFYELALQLEDRR